MTVNNNQNVSETSAHRPALSVNNRLLPQTGDTGTQNGLIPGIALGLTTLATMFAFGKKRRHDDE